MTGARLFLLGGFDLTIDGSSHDVQPASQRVLAMVALAPHGMKRDSCAFQLWPDSPERRAKANLRSCLWRIGKLPEHILVSTKSTIRLHSDLWVDVRDGLEELAASADPTVIGASLLPFHALQADLLPDWYDDWLVVERERFRQLRLTAIESHARSALECGDTSAAIQLALTSVSIDPHRVQGHRLVARAHLAEGNNYEARREYDYYCDLLDRAVLPLPVRFDDWVIDLRDPVTLR